MNKAFKVIPLYSFISPKKLVVVLLVFFYTFNVTAQPDSSLPPILDYFPECQYKVIKNINLKHKTEHPFARETTEHVLNKLRRKAQSHLAEAVIILNRKVKKDIGKTGSYLGVSDNSSHYFVIYNADLINKCNQTSHNQNKPTPINSSGEKTFSSDTSTSNVSMSYTFTMPQKEKPKRPNITNTELSLAKGLYGIKLGSSYQEVYKKLGTPSIELNHLKNEHILGYGRSHWFHFQAGELVKIQTSIPLVSQQVLNKTPLLEFFDGNKWNIESIIPMNTRLSDVVNTLKANNELNDKNQLIYSDKTQKLTLSFVKSKDPSTLQTQYFLKDFKLELSSKNKTTPKIFSHESRQIHVLQSAYLEWQNNKEPNWQILNQKLSEPLASINLPENSQLKLYYPNVIIKTKNNSLSTIEFIERPLINTASNVVNKPWSLGPFTQGMEYAQLDKHIPTSAYITDDEVQLDNDTYQLSLYFDSEKDNKKLYEAKVTFY